MQFFLSQAKLLNIRHRYSSQVLGHWTTFVTQAATWPHRRHTLKENNNHNTITRQTPQAQMGLCEGEEVKGCCIVTEVVTTHARLVCLTGKIPFQFHFTHCMYKFFSISQICLEYIFTCQFKWDIFDFHFNFAIDVALIIHTNMKI